jgi:hypothetical protein
MVKQHFCTIVEMLQSCKQISYNPKPCNYVLTTWAFVLLCTTNDDEMKKRNNSLHLKILLFLNIYRIQIIQNTAQLSSKGRSAKQVGIKSLN